MYNLFSVVLLPQPVRDINLVREIISNIDTVAELQELTVKYRNTEKLAERVKKKSGYLDQRKISRKFTFYRDSLELEVGYVSSCLHKLTFLLFEKNSNVIPANQYSLCHHLIRQFKHNPVCFQASLLNFMKLQFLIAFSVPCVYTRSTRYLSMNSTPKMMMNPTKYGCTT